MNARSASRTPREHDGRRRPRRSARFAHGTLAATALSFWLTTTESKAVPTGVATPSCNGCHSALGFDGEIVLTPQGPLEPGRTTEFALTIRESQMISAGFFVTTEGIGSFGVSGTGARITSNDLVHSRPMLASEGAVELRFEWTAPTEPGGADFLVAVVAANDDRRSVNDRAMLAIFSHVWGCDGITLYRDGDGDGFGQDDSTTKSCEERAGWSATPGDCNDFWDYIFPGAEEQGNGKDDDCDGEVDEGVEFTVLYPDQDGDGFGYLFGDPVESSVAIPGYVPNSEDCDDRNPYTHPETEEVCDGYDNNCNREIDEGVHQVCGIGRCARLLEVCDTECVPGSPEEERCNGLDDDCDGEVDEGTLCPEGQICDFMCRTPDGDAETPGSEQGSEDEESPALVDPGHDEPTATPSGSGDTMQSVTPDFVPAGTDRDASAPDSTNGASRTDSEEEPSENQSIKDETSVLADDSSAPHEMAGCLIAAGSTARPDTDLVWFLGAFIAMWWRGPRRTTRRNEKRSPKAPLPRTVASGTPIEGSSSPAMFRCVQSPTTMVQVLA